MTNTGYARTSAFPQRYRANLPDRHATGADWETLEIFEVAPPSSEPWHAAIYCTADTDAGTVGQLRLRSSAAKAPTGSGVWAVSTGKIITPSGSVAAMAGFNGGAPLALGQFSSSAGEYVAWAYEGFPPYTLSTDNHPTGFAPAGGHLNAGRYWNHELNTWVDLPDRAYAFTGVMSAEAVTRGIVKPADHWHAPLFRMNCLLRSGALTWQAGITKTQTIPEYVARVQELVALGFTVAVEPYDLTQTNPTLPAGLVSNPMLAASSLADGAIRDAVEFYDALCTAFPGGSHNVWIGLPNESHTVGPASTNYRDMIVTLARRIRGKGFTGLITLPLAYWSQDLGGLAAGDYDTLSATLAGHSVGPWAWEFHNYGKRWVGGSASTYTWAQMDDDLAACLADGRAVWMAEYGEATPVGTGTTGDDAADRRGVDIVARSTFGEALAVKYPHTCATWWALADHTFRRGYSPTYGPQNKGNPTGPDPHDAGGAQGTVAPWDINGSPESLEWLTPGGAAHWQVAHSLDAAGAAVGVSPPVTVPGFTRNVRLGFEGIPAGTQLLYVEGRRVSGAGGVRLIQARPTILSAPPAELITGDPPAPLSLLYAWENRPAYVEPNPAGAAGSPGKILADSLGLLRRVSVNSSASLAAAKVAAIPGDQIYVTATITGNGTNRVLDWTAGDPSGTATNPIMITCAPGVWLDGGQAAGAEDLNSRGFYIVGTDHIWLYGLNVRRANFLGMFNECNGTVAAPIRVWHCTFQDSGHSMLNIAGNFGTGGSSSYFSVKYNTFDNSGLANQTFGEAVYIGYGSTNSPTLQPNHDITIEANYFTRLTAEACDMKAGSQKVYFRYNLIENCGDHASPARTGDAANIGFPGAFQFPGQTTPPSGWSALSEIIGNRWKNITSASTKYPDGLVLVGARGFKVVGNLFTEINVGSAGLIVFYLDGNVPTAPGDTGTVEAHNNTARDCNSMNALYRVTNAGASQPALLAIMNANSNHSNNVRANSPSAATGADYSVTDSAFTADGTGYSGSFSAPAPGGPLDVTGADTTAQWTGLLDYAGQTVAAPVKPGAYQ